MEWGGLLRKVRTQDTTEKGATAPANAAPATNAVVPPDDAAAPPTPPAPAVPAERAAVPLLQRRTWASGAFLAAAARLVARGEETSYTLRRVVEWATAATGARRAVLWAIDEPGDTEQPLTMLAWAATDGWRPGDAPAPSLNQSPTLLRASRNPETVLLDLSRPMEQAVGWLDLLGTEPIALCAAISGGSARGILAVAGTGTGTDTGAPFGEDARAALAACAALAAIVFDRRKTDEVDATEGASAEATATPPASTIAPETQAEETAPAPIDPFLSLPDRDATLGRLREEIGRARRFGHPLAMLVLDVDRFAAWSARVGAAGSAAALSHIVEIVRGSIRDVDLLGRGEEDELLLILPVSEIDDALRVGERIRETLGRRQPDGAASSEELRLTVSGGAVGFPDDGSTAEELLAAAEHTVSYAKRMGRDQIRLRGLGDMESPSLRQARTGPLGSVAVPDAPRITQVFQGLLDALTAAGDAHDQARPGHGRAVGRYARALAEACGLDPEQARMVELAGMLHDAGKIGLPDTILSKRGPLMPEERAVLREQPAVGKLMLLQVPSLERVVPLVEHAHERYDGSGYPAGLRGNQIPFGARIIALAEGYEAMTSDRPYRRALSHSMAVAELWREAGGRYDPRLVDTFVRLVSPVEDTQDGNVWNPEMLEQITVDPAPPSTWEAVTSALAPTAAPETEATTTRDDNEVSTAPLKLPQGRTIDLPDIDLPLLPQQPNASATGATKAAAPPPQPSDLPLGATEAALAAAILPFRLATDETAPTGFVTAPAEEAAPTDPQPAEATKANEGAIDTIEWFDEEVGADLADDDQPLAAHQAEPPVAAEVPPVTITSQPVAQPPAAAPLAQQAPTRPPTRPNTGPLMMRQAPPPPAPAAQQETDSAESPDQLSVDDTILVMSQTTLLRMAELGRLNKRRTGFLFSDQKKDE